MGTVAASPAPPAEHAAPRAVPGVAPVIVQPMAVPWTATTPPAGEQSPPTVSPRADVSASTRTAVSVARFAAWVYAFVLVFLVLVATAPALVAGWQPLAVVSGSMQPAVAPGSLVLVQPADPDQFYAHPSIVTFTDEGRSGELVTHRVVDTDSHDGTVVYTTKGDANRVADSDLVRHEDTLGAVRMVVPFVGLPVTWLRHGELVRMIAWLGASVLAIGVLAVRVRP